MNDTTSTDLTQGTDFTVTDRVVTLAKPTDMKVQIYRRTDTKPLIGWADASVLKAADMTVQSTQLLHLAEESLDMAQEKGLTTDDKDGVWDARFNKIKNLLDPTEDGDAVTLHYITQNQDSLINKLNTTGDANNKAIVATGAAQNKRLTDTGNTQNSRLISTGDAQVSRISTIGDVQNSRLVSTGDSYNSKLISTGTSQNQTLEDTGKRYTTLMTTLRDTMVSNAAEATNSATLAQKWAESDTSPDGDADSKSAKTWAAAAKTSEIHAETAMNNAATFRDKANTYQAWAANSASHAETSATTASQKASEAASSATAAAKSATDAATSLTQLGEHEANAAASAEAAAKSAENAKLWDPTGYARQAEVLPLTARNMKVVETEGVTDLNDIKVLSYTAWICHYDSTTPKVANCPSTKAFYLFNFSNSTKVDGALPDISKSWYSILQVLINLDGAMWVRKVYNQATDTFKTDPWQQIATTTNAATKEYVDAFKPSMLIDNTSLYNYLHRLGLNPALPTTNKELCDLGIFSSYFYSYIIKNQPTQWGQLINIPASSSEAAQLWLEQGSSNLYYRTGNASHPIEEQPFTRFLTTNDAIPSKTSQLTNDSNFVTKDQIPSVPTKTSQLTNDSDFATNASVDNKIKNNKPDLSNYYTKAETYSRDQVASIIAANKPDLSNYYTKSETYSIDETDTKIATMLMAKVPTKTSQLTNDSGFATINSSGHLVFSNETELWIE